MTKSKIKKMKRKQKICEYCKKVIRGAYRTQKCHKKCSKIKRKEDKIKYMRVYNKLPYVKERTKKYWKKRWRTDEEFRKKKYETSKKWRKKNPEKFRAMQRKWASKNYYKRKGIWDSLSPKRQLELINKKAKELLND